MEENGIGNQKEKSESNIGQYLDGAVEDVMCLKCGTIISHIPYKYEGQTFHARCLVCNFCGKNLVGKPFLTDITKLFCGDQCKHNYEEMPMTMAEMTISEDSMEGGGSSPVSTTMDESLIEALESIKESKRDILRLARQPSPLQIPDPDRLTDYPRTSSPDSSLPRTPLSGSRCSSLSAVSQSSLTSDSSYSFDASRRPKKKILKHPHRPHRGSRNRVRWNLPNGGCVENDSDNTSLDSFDSTSTSSSIYFKARSGVNDVRTNWKEFERNPNPGSTGLTPAKLFVPRNHFYNRPSSAPVSPAHSQPTQHPYHQNSPVPQITVSGIPIRDSSSTKFTRNLSPLTTSPQSQNMFSALRATSHSTPMQNSSSSSGTSTGRTQLWGSPRRVNSPGSDDDIDVPIFTFDNSALSELEESTLEDRKRMHIFAFPQNTNAGTSSRQVVSSSNTEVRTAFLTDDDENDYDHLSPIKEVSSTSPAKKLPNKPKLATSSLYTRGEGHLRRSDAMQLFGSDNSSRPKKSSPTFETPPPIPPKKIDTHQTNSGIQELGKSSVSTAGIVASATKRTQLKNLDNRSKNNNNLPSPTSPLTAEELKQKPPPVPPKVRQKRSTYQRERSSSTLSPTSPSNEDKKSFPGQQHSPQDHPRSRDWNKGSQEDILPPPPEFAFPSGENEDITSFSQGSDPLSSVSNSTLIDEQELPANSPRASRGMAHKRKGEDVSMVSPPSPQKAKLAWNLNPLSVQPNHKIGVAGNKLVDTTPLHSTLQMQSKSSIQGPYYRNDKVNSSEKQRFGMGQHPSVNSNSQSEQLRHTQETETRKFMGSPKKSEDTWHSNITSVTSGQQVPTVVARQTTDQPEQNKDSGNEGLVCDVCCTKILSYRDLYTHNSINYHRKCFRCTVCRSFLRGKKIHKVKNKILCRDCFPKYEVTVGQSVNSGRLPGQVQASNYPVSKFPVISSANRGQITSV